MFTMDIPNKNTRALALKAKLDVPMAILAIIWVVVIVASLILEENNSIKNSLDGLDWIIWFVFLVEYFTLVFLAEEKIYYIRRNILDLIIVFLPALRILRIARALEIFKSATVFSETFRELSLFLHHKKIYNLLFLAFFVTTTGGVLIHLVEAPSNPIFERYAHSFWWAMATMFTFGHSGISPVSSAGQTIGVILALFGAGFALYFAFALVSWIAKRNNSRNLQG
ncbi:MAG: ion channel [bacterium]|nr:ion channel [bacterium]